MNAPLRRGFTTGTCAAAATKGALVALFAGTRPERVAVDTLNGVRFDAELLDMRVGADSACCAVRKDGGDDPDVTTGLLVYATVTLVDDGASEVRIDGGEGVGRVTRPGLDRNVGEAAINTGPRRAIETAARDVMNSFDYNGSVEVVVSVPGGDVVAKKTFNPRLGIEGGISILGTTGVVEPMSLQAILDTIRVELRQQRALQRDIVAIAPGNYGLDFIKSRLGFDLDKAVKCSNFVGASIDLAVELGFTEVLICGHIGKLIKTSGGIMNTHSREADARLELTAAAALEVGCSRENALKILRCVSTDEALEVLRTENLEQPFFDRVVEKLRFYLDKRAADRLRVEAIVYSNKTETLAATPGADAMLRKLRDVVGDVNNVQEDS